MGLVIRLSVIQMRGFAVTTNPISNQPLLWNDSSLKGYAVVATDGLVGTICDFIFEDKDWKIIWVVVETGTWLSGRKVFVPASNFQQPDQGARQYQLNMTLAQVGYCLHGDVAQLGDETSGAHFTQGELTSEANKHKGPHLRALNILKGASVEVIDGDVGHAEEFLIDTSNWLVKYLVIHTSSWWPGEKLLISAHSIKGIDYTRNILQLDATRQFVKDSPPYNAEQTADGIFDESFQTYYGIRFLKKIVTCSSQISASTGA